MAKTVKQTGTTTKTAKPRKTAPRKAAEAKVTETPISHDQIAELAHKYWLERGGAHGYDEVDWLRAEVELCGKKS